MVTKNTFDFLKSLKKNNDRDWFIANKEKYESSRKEFELLVGEIIKGIGQFDKGIKGLKAKDCIFRIYRDVRFSKDKSPYKTQFGAFMSSSGKTANGPGYYIHLEPGNCFLGGGIYMPQGEQLNAIRKEIDFNFKDFQKILKGKEFSKYFNGLSDLGKLVMAPKGFPKDHPALEILKNKSFVAAHSISDARLMEKDFAKFAVQVFKALFPLNRFLDEATS